MTEILSRPQATRDIVSARMGLFVGGRWLFVLRARGSSRNANRWQIPGGKQDYDENGIPIRNLLETAVDELGQETGLVPRGKIIGLVKKLEDHTLPDDPTRRKISHGFVATDYSGELRLQHKECQNSEWLTHQEALRRPLTQESREFMLLARDYIPRLIAAAPGAQLLQ